MSPDALIPTPDAIPAPWALFEVLDVALFLVHLLFMNVMLGGVLIALATKFTKGPGQQLAEAGSSKVPTVIALAVNAGVAPLLFMQVIYGHLFYTSSIFMAAAWILIIPLLILAYYGSYIHKHNPGKPALANGALALAAVIFLYIAFLFSNNMTMMMRPELWPAFFSNRGGWMLATSDPALWPRFLHFVVASVAVAGLFLALVWERRGKRAVEDAPAMVKRGLAIFAYATIVQIIIGLWWIVALPREIMLEFMGGSAWMTGTFLVGFLLALGALAVALRGKLRATLLHLLAIMVVMVLQRALLRASYLEGKVDFSAVEIVPQNSVLILFAIVLGLGAWAVVWMVRRALEVESKTGRASS